MRGTSHARPCGASRRCRARLERSSSQDLTASVIRPALRPRRRKAAFGSRSIDLEHVLAVELEQPLGSPAADVPDALQIHEQRGLARGRERLGGRDLDLQPVALVVLPLAADADPLACLEVGDRPDEHDLVAGAVGVDDREARLVARPAEPPDDDLVLELRAGDAFDHRWIVVHAPDDSRSRSLGGIAPEGATPSGSARRRSSTRRTRSARPRRGRGGTGRRTRRGGRPVRRRGRSPRPGCSRSRRG